MEEPAHRSPMRDESRISIELSQFRMRSDAYVYIYIECIRCLDRWQLDQKKRGTVHIQNEALNLNDFELWGTLRAASRQKAPERRAHVAEKGANRVEGCT